MKLQPTALILSALLCVLAAGCVGSSAPLTIAPAPAAVAVAPTATHLPPPTTAPTSTVPPMLTLEPCRLGDYGARCGTFQVWEDRAAGSGRKIKVKIAVIPAQNVHPATDPIFFLAGGPGEAATENASWVMQILGPANVDRDVVLVDQRGTGGSNKLTCAAPADKSKQMEALRECVTQLNGESTAYTTAWGMDDVDDVRAALGYDQINLYGGSYGATAAQVYIQRYGEHVRTAALEGVSLLDVPMYERFPTASQKALDSLFSRCEIDAACHSAYPNFRVEFAAVLTRLDEAPLTLPVNDPSTGQPALLTAQTFKTVVHSALADTGTAVMIPKFTHLVHIGDLQALAQFFASLAGGGSNAPLEWTLMSLNILCSEDWSRVQKEETLPLTEHSYLKYEDVRELSVLEEICAIMPPPKPESLYGPATASPVPVLLISGGADPQDPPENVVGAKERYPNSLSLIAGGQGHNFAGVPCHASIVADFIERGSVEGLKTECLSQIALPGFID